MAEFKSDHSTLNLDPDYFVPKEESDSIKDSVLEENARSNSVKKISAIIEKEFTKEIESKKLEIKNIYKVLTRATKTMHYLRFAIITDYYGKLNKCNDPSLSGMQTRPHPTVNAPKKKVPFDNMEYKCCEELGIIDESKRLAAERAQNESNDNEANNFNPESKCAKPKEVIPGTNSSCKIKKKIVVGNFSMWIDPKFRGENKNISHKWTIYVKDVEEGDDLSSVISKVRFFLDPSYKPNDVVEVSSPPFNLVRFGWGEFPVRVQLHFVNVVNKPVDIIHQLVLDQTYTGLQMRGAQTLVEMEIRVKNSSIINANFEDDSKKEFDDGFIESNLELLLNKKIKDERSNVTICHDLPIDHDYVNLNSKKLSDDFSCERNSLKLNNETKVRNNDSTLIKTDLKQVPLKNKVIPVVDQEKSKNRNLENLSNSVNVASVNTKQTKYLSSKEITEALVHLVNHVDNLPKVLKIIASKTPLITEKASNPLYKAQHPYASESYIIYSGYSKAKQSFLERQRAIRALEILSKSRHKVNDMSVKDFSLWARKYGYTPIENTTWMTTNKKNKLTNEKDVTSSIIKDEVNDWIKDLENKKSNLNQKIDNDEEIDVTSFQTTLKTLKRKNNDDEKSFEDTLIQLDYSENQKNLLEYTKSVVDRQGLLRLSPEVIINGVVHSKASLVITKAIECFVDDIIRLSHSCAVERCEKNDIVIKVDDVRTALLKKDEFEILTNSGLGTAE